MTLHFSQIGLTDDLTFTVNPPFRLPTERHPGMPGASVNAFLYTKTGHFPGFFKNVQLAL
jgi:hypothetical protein